VSGSGQSFRADLSSLSKLTPEPALSLSKGPRRHFMGKFCAGDGAESSGTIH
jgi:hypothetical protein